MGLGAQRTGTNADALATVIAVVNCPLSLTHSLTSPASVRETLSHDTSASMQGVSDPSLFLTGLTELADDLDMKSKIKRRIKDNPKAPDPAIGGIVALFPETGQTVAEKVISCFAFCA